MGLEDSFNQSVQEWIEHCKNPKVQASSNSEPVRNCDAYKRIVSMGKEVLPLIRQLYDTDASFFIHGQDSKGEYAVLPTTKRLTRRQDFFDGLFAFQYGETAEESNAGFDKMTQVGQEEAARDFPLGIVKGHGLVFLVRDIIGDDFQIPQEIRGNIPKIEAYTKRWLDENMSKYLNPAPKSV